MIPIIAALFAAAANASSSILQRKANLSEPDELSMSPRLIFDLLHRPLWLGGVGAVTAGFLLQALALAKGKIAVVEPLLVVELPLTLLLASRVFHRRLHRREWLEIAGMTVGLMAMLFSLRPRGGHPAGVSALEWVIGIGATLGLVAGLVLAGMRAGGLGRSALYGVATGTSFGLTAVLIAAATAHLSHGIGAVLTSWQTYGFVATGLLGMFMLQNALQAGPLVAAQPGFTLADPIVSVIWGILVFGEQVRSGPWLAGEVAGASLIAFTTVSLARSPLLHADPRQDSAAGRRRRR